MILSVALSLPEDIVRSVSLNEKTMLMRVKGVIEVLRHRMENARNSGFVPDAKTVLIRENLQECFIRQVMDNFCIVPCAFANVSGLPSWSLGQSNLPESQRRGITRNSDLFFREHSNEATTRIATQPTFSALDFSCLARRGA